MPTQLFHDNAMPRRPHTARSQAARPRSGDQQLFAEATASHQAGNLAEAEKLYRRLLKRHARDPALRERLGVVLMQRGNYSEAVGSLRQAIAEGRREASTYNNLALALSGDGRYEDAVEAARTATRLHPEKAEYHINLGHRLKKTGRVDDAKAAYRQATTLNPGFASGYVALGNLCAAMGEGDTAVDLYRKALAVQPNHVRAFYHLALSNKGNGTVIDLATIEMFRNLADEGNLGRFDAMLVRNALGFIADQRREYAAAFDHFRTFNEAVRRARTENGRPYDRAAHRRLVDQIIKAFPIGTFETVAKPRTTGPQPLFIVGMPRSGTTLVEQILGSHEAVAPGGELLEFDQITEAVADYPAGVWRLRSQTLEQLAARYLDALRRVDATSERVSDKLPRNFLHLGFIARLFPGAAIVHCRRDPVDTCLSCYFQNFTAGGGFSNDLTDLGSYYRDYHRLMAHWRSVLPRAPVEVVYEELVADPEPTVRRLLEAVGLEWDAACLGFSESRRPVMTASQWQVRQPIYTKAVGRWRHYREHLEPLLEALGDLAGDT